MWRIFSGNVIMFSTILCRLGSKVKGDGPATLSTIILINCRNDKVAESPIYTSTLILVIMFFSRRDQFCKNLMMGHLHNRPLGSWSIRV